MSRMIPGGDTIHGRLRLVTGTVGALLVLSSAVGWWTTRRLTDTIREALTAVEHETALSTRFAGSIALQVQAGNRYLDTRDPAARAEFDRLGATAHQIHGQLGRQGGQTPEELALIARIDQQLSRAEALYARAHRLADLGRAAQAAEEQERARPVVQATLADVEQLGALTARKVAGISSRLQEDAVREGWQLVGLLLGAILIAVAVSRMVAGSISDSLRVLVQHSERLSRGELSARIPPGKLPGEFRVLAASMNQAAAALEDQTATESALHQAEKFAALGQLVSGVAHELNAPLAGALLETDNLLDAVPDDPQRAALTEIRSRLLRARRIIRDLLSFVKDRHAANEPVTPEALIDRALRAVEPQLREAGVKVRRTLPDRLPLLMADRVGIEQALSNLLLNGAQAAGSGGTVHVAARTVDDWCEITIEDNGPGIPPEILPRIFEPFFTTRAPGEGTGLGLSAALGVVEQHWGRLRAENRSDQRGARFVMALPCSWDGSETPPAGSMTGA